MASRAMLALIGVLLLTFPMVTGCLGGDEADANDTGAEAGPSNDSSQDDGSSSSGTDDESNQTGESQTDGDQAPPPMNHKEWTDSASTGVPVTFVEDGADFTKMSLENGANGTYVLGYDFEVPVGVNQVVVQANASEVGQNVPDYDLYVWNETGALQGGSTNEGTAEEVTVRNPVGGTYLIGLLYWAGADAEGTIAPVTITADAA